MKYQQLSENWLLQSSEEIFVHGETISTAAFSPRKWYPVTIPATVVSGLVENGVYDDPYVGLNMRSIPGYKHGRTSHFSFYPMPDDSPFRKPWWYRNVFNPDKSFNGKRAWMRFKGINYSANIWLNGTRIAGADYIIGSFRRYDIDVTNFIKYGKKNVLAIEVFPPQPDDLSITFIDWGPVPPDDSMGIWQPVSVYATDSVAIKHPFVRSELDVETLKTAELFFSTQLVNTGAESVTGTLEGSVEGISFTKKVTLNPFEAKEVICTPDEFPQLSIQDPRVWWPYQLGSPELYSMSVSFSIDSVQSDSREVSFGIRDIQSRINEHGARQFTINGRDILIRGSAWTPDLMLRQSEERDRVDIAMLKNMHMNTFRLEGKLASDNFWELCDREGILVMAGWPCCTHWEKWDNWKPGDMIIARKSLVSQIKRLRNHPCFIAWFYGSDFPPPEPVERLYLEALKETYKELPAISNASKRPSAIQGETGVKMSGPYTYVPPIYWYHPDMPGRAENFNTETGPDVTIPVMESLRKMLPEDQLFVGSDAWNHHAGLASFTDTEQVNSALEKRYGKTRDIHDFVKTAQVLGYELWRAMYEAYGRNYPRGTGVIGWMHNSAWPSMIWQLYDYYLQPTGAFYGSQKACEPLHIQYSYDDASIWIVNSLLQKHTGLSAHAVVYNIDLQQMYECSEKVDIDEYGRVRAFLIPEIKELSSVYFLFLTLSDASQCLSRNCYWLSTREDILAKKSKQLFYWPVTQHADMSLLRSLPKAELKSSYGVHKVNGNNEVSVTIKNVSDTLAFFVWVKVIDTAKNDLVAPVYWKDNCLSLLPNEERTLVGLLPDGLNAGDIDVVVESWN